MTTGDTIVFDDPYVTLSPGGSRAKAVATATNATTVVVIVTDGGSGYTSAPTVTLSGAATGTLGAATATVAGGKVTGIAVAASSGLTPGDTIDVSIGLGDGGKDISAAVTRAKLMVEYIELEAPPTSGTKGIRNEVASQYRWSVEINFLTDGFGADTIDSAIRSYMHPPFGPATNNRKGKAEIALRFRDEDVSADNPEYSGTITIGNYEPLGGAADIPSIVQQTRTWKGTGDLTLLPAA